MAGHSLDPLIHPTILWMILYHLLLPFLSIHHLKVPPSYDVLGSHDPFDFLDPEASVATDDCSSFCVSPTGDDDSSLSTVQHANTDSEKLDHTPADKVPLLLPLHFQNSGGCQDSGG